MRVKVLPRILYLRLISLEEAFQDLLHLTIICKIETTYKSDGITRFEIYSVVIELQ